MNLNNKSIKDFIPRIEFTILLTKYCNLDCSYCNQSWDHKELDKVSFKSYKLMITSIFRRLSKIKHPKSIVFTVMGGELSVKYKEQGYFEYFNLLKDQAIKYNIDTEFILVSNFTGTADFFQQLINLQTDFFKVNIHTTLHEGFYNTDKRVKEFFNKLNILELKNTTIDIGLLKNNSDAFKLTESLVEKYKPSIINKNLIFSDDQLLKIGKNKNGLFGEEYNTDKGFIKNSRYCNAVLYTIDFNNFILINDCRDTRQTFLKWEPEFDFYNCTQNCKHAKSFNSYLQFSPEEFKEL